MGESSPFPPRKDGYVDCLTSSQKDALQEFYRLLPSAGEGLAPEHWNLWNVPLADLAFPVQRDKDTDEAVNGFDDSADGQKGSERGPGPTRAQSVVLLKFLRARNFHVQAAVTMLVNCLKWRRDFDVAGLSLETFAPQLAAAGQLSGRDRAGNPVTYNYYGSDVDLGSVFSSPGGLASFVRWRVKLMEQAVGMLDFEGGIENVTQVHDYSGASLFRMDSNIKAASRQIIKLFQDNYPEMLSAKLFLNVPRVMEFLFGIFSAFCDPATRAKFVMASPARARAVLLQYVDPVQIPARFGGFLETCSGLPPARGRPSVLDVGSKQVSLKPGDSHVTSKLVGPGSEVVWCFCTTGQELCVSLGFRPQDNGEAAAAAALQPDMMPGGAHLNSRNRESQHITEAHNMVLVKDSESGRIVLGCLGEVTMTLDNRLPASVFHKAQPVTVHYALVANDLYSSQYASIAGSPSFGANSDNYSGRLYPDAGNSNGNANGNGNGMPHTHDWRHRVFSYKSFGCSSFTSDAPPGDQGLPESPSARGGGDRSGGLAQLVGAAPGGALPQLYANGVLVPSAAVASGRFETVQEVDESSTVSPGRTATPEEAGSVFREDVCEDGKRPGANGGEGEHIEQVT